MNPADHKVSDRRKDIFSLFFLGECRNPCEHHSAAIFARPTPLA
jgi:hypothetical protein